MTVAAVLLAYAAFVGTLGARVLARARWTARAPLLGILTYLAGRHHTLKAAALVGRQVLPFLPLLRDAEAQVTRLAELQADDAAVRAADPRALATALVVLATPAHPAPAPALAAAATDAVLSAVTAGKLVVRVRHQNAN